MIDYKKAFYSKLEDCYLGVKIKDFHKGNTAKSGFSNLLKIKEQYFAHIKAYLESQIESEPLSHDIYNKLFTFFDSYLNESGTPFFNDTPIYKNIYAKVYSNSKDTSLFYKTQNLYYVKSDILYQSLTLSDEQENYEVVFDASEYQQNADNIKNKVIFKLDSISCNELAKADEETPNQIIIKVINHKDLFPELNNVFKQNSSEFSEDFLKSLKQKKLKFNEENLKKIFRSYKKQSEIDFFIHKNAKAFLQEQFDLWMFHYLYQESEIQEWNPQIIAHLQKIKNIAHEIIKLIADFENELKAIWLKPKFAKKVEYVFSIDRILQYAHNANALIEAITNDKGFESQIKEWQELRLIDDSSIKGEDTIISPSFTDGATPPQPLPQGEGLLSSKIHSPSRHEGLTSSSPSLIDKATSHSPSLADKATSYSLSLADKATSHSPSLAEGARGWVQALIESDKYRYLPIDTKHFSKETKYKILSSFENVESLLNGELIKSDNFQALNTLMPKYQGKVDLIYIDPPFNLGENASFDYKVNFKDSTWASLLDSRLELARDILSNNGSIFVRCDYNGNFIVRSLLNNIFGEDNFVNEIIVSKSAKLTETIKKYHSGNDSLFFFSKSKEYIFNVQGIEREERKWRAMHLPGERWSPIPKQYIDLFSKENLVFKNSKWTSKARIILGQEYLPPNGRHWALSQETIFELEKQGGIRLIDGVPKTQESDTKKLTSNWTDWVGYSSDWGFQTENHEKVLQRAILTGSNQDSAILDYHLGSGTTLAVAQKLGRKWLGVEMGEHFYDVLIPRLKKVIAGFQSGISKECDYKGGGAFRYYELESYEEALSHCEYALKDSCHCESSLCHSEPALAGEESQQSNKRDISHSPSLAASSTFPPPLRRGLGGGYSKAAALETKSHRYLAPYMKEFSRELRNNPTQAENKLWQELRNKKLGFSFRRQFVIDSKYIADFVCLEKRLIIECDGGQHNYSSLCEGINSDSISSEVSDSLFQLPYERGHSSFPLPCGGGKGEGAKLHKDIERDFYLESHQFRILRFWNNEILENLEGVVGKIQEVLNDSMDLTHPLTPSAREGEKDRHTSAREEERDRRVSTKKEEYLNVEIKVSENNVIYKGKDYAKTEAILDYRKSRKLIDRLHKGEIVSLDMRTEYREGFDIFHTMANLMGWKIKRLFLDSKGIESCEFENGEILNLDSIDLAKYPKLKNLIWWE